MQATRVRRADASHGGLHILSPEEGTLASSPTWLLLLLTCASIWTHVAPPAWFPMACVAATVALSLLICYAPSLPIGFTLQRHNNAGRCSIERAGPLLCCSQLGAHQVWSPSLCCRPGQGEGVFYVNSERTDCFAGVPGQCGYMEPRQLVPVSAVNLKEDRSGKMVLPLTKARYSAACSGAYR